MAGIPCFIHPHGAETLPCTGDIQAHHVFQTPPAPQQHGRGCDWSFYACFQFVCCYAPPFALLEPLGVVHHSELTPLVCGSMTKWRGNTEMGTKVSAVNPSGFLLLFTQFAHLRLIFLLCFQHKASHPSVWGCIPKTGSNVATFEPHKPRSSSGQQQDDFRDAMTYSCQRTTYCILIGDLK